MRIFNFEYTMMILMAILCISVLHLWHTQESLFCFLNFQHHPVVDKSFSTLTYLGKGTCLGVICSLICILRSHWGARFLALVTAFVVSSLIVVIFKHFIWPDAPRPVAVFGADFLETVDGIKMHGRNSFPSGHSATAVALLFVVSLDTHRAIRLALAFIALLIGYSRIYLNQHFALDVSIGSLAGLVAGMTGAYVQYLVVRPKAIPVS